MNPIWVVARKEISSFFDSLVAYVFLIVFLLICGIFTWLYGVFVQDIFIRGQADLMAFFINGALPAIGLFIPSITMGMIAKEWKSGTIELLLTKSVSNSQLVIGKFLACLFLIGSALVFTLPYLITISQIGDLDLGRTLSGYLGLFLISGAYISLGLFASSLTSDQVVAFVISLVLGICFFVLFSLLASNLQGVSSEFFDFASFFSHYEPMVRGVIDTKDVIFFLSITFLGLLLTINQISKRR